MSYAFGLGESQDPWFRVGNVDVTTTVLVTGVAAISTIANAVNTAATGSFSFVTDNILAGELWRVVSWPLAGAPTFQNFLSIAFFFFIGSQIEARLGRTKFTTLLLVISTASILVGIIFGLIASLNIVLAGIGGFTLSLIVAIAIISPFAKSFFQIPIWALAAFFLIVNIVSAVGARDWGGVVFTVTGSLATFVFLLYENQAHEVVAAAPAGKIVTERKQKRAHLTAVPEVSEAEMNILLDKISSHGVNSLTKEEKKKLKSFSNKKR